jgi:hypothetical protein
MFIGRGGFRRPNLSPCDGDDEQDDSGSIMYDQYGYLCRRTYDCAIDPSNDDEKDEY